MYAFAEKPEVSGRRNFTGSPAPVSAVPEPHLSGSRPPQAQACSCGGSCPNCSLKRPPESEIFRQGGAGGPQPAPPTQGTPIVPRDPVPGFFSCPSPLYDVDQIRTAISTAKSWLGIVIPTLDLFRMGGLSGIRETAVRVALRENFNLTDTHPRLTLGGATPLETILANLESIKQALDQPMQFWCTRACLPGDLAWVLRNPERLGLPNGIINICPEFFGCDPLKQASTIIHERAHQAINASDHAYEVSSSYDALATVTALQNADSYAVLTRQIFFEGVHGPGLSCSIVNSRIRNFELTAPTLELPDPL